jgi:4-hydroxy-tetrahydrodipicolinate synthase
MPGMDLLDGIIEVWHALQDDNHVRAYEIYFPICALIALQLQAGLDGLLAIEKYLLVKRGLFTTANRRKPFKWELDKETQLEIDRLFTMLQDCL